MVMIDPTLELISSAKAGDRDALTALVREVQPQLFTLCVRMLGCPHDAEDACQEILVRMITRLASFRGDSRFSTWLYRVAIRHLIDFRRSRAEKAVTTFEAFSEDLHTGSQEPARELRERPDYNALLHEVKTGCSLAMLLCLDRGHRAAYIVGEILELDHVEAARVLGVPSATFRKRLSRARAKVLEFTRDTCGLVNPDAPCRCARRLSPAITLGRITLADRPAAISPATARPLAEVADALRALKTEQRTVELFRSQSIPVPHDNFSSLLDTILDGMDKNAALLARKAG
jgi:RNA polymerase sigma factor (sigma-70 family)